MAATESLTLATRLPGPPELLPGRPDAIVDLQTDAGTALVGGQWRYADAAVAEIDFVELGSPDDPLGPGYRRAAGSQCRAESRVEPFDPPIRVVDVRHSP